MAQTPWFVWLLPFIVASPWIAAIAWYLPRLRSDREVPPSMGEMARRRLWTN